nr:MAG TPA: hypothetical protein [Caudoviricetes sp.]
MRPSSQGNGSSMNCGTGRIHSMIFSICMRSCSWRERIDVERRNARQIRR